MERGHLASAERVKRFTLAYLELLGGSIEEVGPDLFRVELAPQRALEFEPSAPWWLWNQPTRPGSQLTYYFTFTPSAARAPEAELVSPGCHRLHQMIKAVRKRGQGARLWVPPPPGAAAGAAVVYRPFFYLLLRLEYRAPRGGVRLFPVAVDRVEHLPLRQLGALIPSLPLRAGRPDAPYRIEEASLLLGSAFDLAFMEALDALEREDPSWAEEALNAVQAERERLIAFYADRESEGEVVEAERARRLEELRALEPRVLVRLQLFAEVDLPLAQDDGRPRHLAFAYSGLP